MNSSRSAAFWRTFILLCLNSFYVSVFRSVCLGERLCVCVREGYSDGSEEEGQRKCSVGVVE